MPQTKHTGSRHSLGATLASHTQGDAASEDANATAQLRNLIAASTTAATATADSGSDADGAAARLNNLMKTSVQPEGDTAAHAQLSNTAAHAQLSKLASGSIEAVEYTVPETPEQGGKQSPIVSPFKLAAESRPHSSEAAVRNTAGAESASGNEAAEASVTLHADGQQPPSNCRMSATRRISSHFGSSLKRRRSSEPDGHMSRPHPYGILGGLVNKLQINRAGSAVPSDACSDGDVDVDLETRTSAEMASGDAEASAGEDDMCDDERCVPIAGLEHVQPFASIANMAVASIEAASLQKFGMSKSSTSRHGLTKLHNDVLQPFAPPRRKKGALIDRSQSAVAPSLQQFACTVTQTL